MKKWKCVDLECLEKEKCQCERVYRPYKCLTVGCDAVWEEASEPAAMEEPAVEAKSTKGQESIPDWCKVGAWVWSRGQYAQVDYYRPDSVHAKYKDGGFGGHPNGPHIVPARVRPWTFEGAPDHIRVIESGRKTVLYLGHETEHMCSFFYYSMNSRDAVDAEWLSRNMVQLDGSPCGVLEHLENGKWVE